MFKTPVAIFGFNRPSLINQVFERVREVKPQQLFLILDGPRVNTPDDLTKCNMVKEILSRVDWPCETLRNYSKTNMGCRRRISSGISWVFEHSEEAIILEDDCVPDLTFFKFCAELLARYRNDSRVGMIAGHIEHFDPPRVNGCSYYVDHFTTIWGWATWRRAWAKYDAELTNWPLAKEQDILMRVLKKQRYVKSWTRMIDRVCEGKTDTWDTAWAFTLFYENWLCVHPKQNLVTNIGCGSDSTHTINVTSQWANQPTVPMDFPLVHPAHLIPDLWSEKRVQETLYSPSITKRIMSRAKKLFNPPKKNLTN